MSAKIQNTKLIINDSIVDVITGYKVHQKKHPLKTKKRTNKSNNPKFKWMRNYHPECVVCGDYGEIHHIDIGLGNGDDDRVVMLCMTHHSAQSNTGLHKSPKDWYEKFISFEELEAQAEDIHCAWMVLSR